MVKLQCVFLEKNQKSHGRGWTLSVEKSHKIDFWLLMFFGKNQKLNLYFCKTIAPHTPQQNSCLAVWTSEPSKLLDLNFVGGCGGRFLKFQIFWKNENHVIDSKTFFGNVFGFFYKYQIGWQNVISKKYFIVLRRNIFSKLHFVIRFCICKKHQKTFHT